MRFRIAVICLLLFIFGGVGLWNYASTPLRSYRLSVAHFLIGELDLAQAALLLAPEDAALAYRAANFYLGEKAHDLAKAEELYTKALYLGYPEPAYAHFGLSRAHFFQGRYSHAIEDINEAMRLDPSIENSIYMRGLIYGYKNNLPEAARDFENFLELKPESWAGANDLAWIYFRQGDYAAVEKVVVESLKYNQNNPWLLNSLGVALLNLDQKREAREALEKALVGFKGMTPAEWGAAYPGNDARYHAQGLASTIRSVEKNIRLASGAPVPE